jgi:acyl dehydratase
MTNTRALSSSPATLPLLLRASLPLIPGASALPFVAGGGNEIPDIELTLAGARLSSERLAAYARVCEFATPRETLSATAPHLLAFPLHMALMTDGSFPFPAVGLVHVSNRIAVHRPIGVDEPLDLRVRATPLEPHAKGRTFTIVTEVRVGSELVWEERSTMLRRGRGDGSASGRASASTTAAAGERPANGAAQLQPAGSWHLAEDLGRRYASVSGDRNPIHMHALSARLFGFPRAIAHGMWTKARCLAALEDSLGDAYSVEVEFRKPIFLPGDVSFASAHDSAGTSFAVRSSKDETTIHLEGTVTR